MDSHTSCEKTNSLFKSEPGARFKKLQKGKGQEDMDIKLMAKDDWRTRIGKIRERRVEVAKKCRQIATYC